jgi:predicted amidohydrolase
MRLARDARADLLVFPELFNSGYLLGSRRAARTVAEPIPHGPTCKALIDFCTANGVFVVAGMAESADSKRSRVYNSAVFIGPNGFIGTYRKIHLFKDEKDWFDPGDSPFKVFDVGFARVGIMICFDWIFPESARSLALAGADIICHPANLVLPYCQDAMTTRSIENRIFTITANRIGGEGAGKNRVVFTGRSQVTDPLGRRLIAAPRNKECVRMVSIDPSLARDKYVTSKNSIIGDRRPGMYLGVRQPTYAAARQTRNQFQNG